MNTVEITIKETRKYEDGDVFERTYVKTEDVDMDVLPDDYGMCDDSLLCEELRYIRDDIMKNDVEYEIRVRLISETGNILEDYTWWELREYLREGCY